MSAPSPALSSLERLLERLRLGGRRLGVQERLRVLEALREQSELLEPGREHALATLVASLLARSPDEWSTLVEAVRRRGRGPKPSPGPESARRRGRGSAVPRSAPLAGRRPWILGCTTALLLLLLGGAFAWFLRSPVEPTAPTPVPIDAGAPEQLGPEPSAAAPVALELVEPARRVGGRVEVPPGPIGAAELLALLAPLLLLTLGLRFGFAARYERREQPRRLAETRRAVRKAQQELERGMAREASTQPGPGRHSPVDAATTLRTASLMGGIGQRSLGEELAVEATVRETASAGGRLSPRYEQRHRPGGLTVLLDVEDGDHLWLPGLRRLLADWRRLGVLLEIYEFRYEPLALTREDGQALPLAEVLRRHAGGHLLLLSRHVRPDERGGAATWPRLLSAWPTRAWLDPEPYRPGLPAPPYLRELEGEGLTRFPVSPDGVLALSRYLASDGQSAVRAPWPVLPRYGELGPQARRAVDRWVVMMAAVPNGTPDQAEQARRLLCAQNGVEGREAQEVLGSFTALRLLVDELEARDPGWRGDGVLPVEVSRGYASELLAEVRRRARAIRGGAEVSGAQVWDLERWERLAREAWIEDLRSKRSANEEEELQRRLDLCRQHLLSAKIRAELEEALGELVALLPTAVGAQAAQDLRSALPILEATGGPHATLIPKVEKVLGSEDRVQLTALFAPRPASSWLRSLAAAAVGTALLAVAFFALLRTPLYTTEQPATALLPATYEVPAPDEPPLPAPLEKTSTRPRMMPIPRGRFTMGSPPDEEGRDDDEEQHEVEIPRPFWLARTEVTQGQWKALMGNTPSGFKACGEDCPVEQVNWWEAASYCNRLSAQEGLQACYALKGCEGEVGGTERFQCEGVDFAKGCSGYRLPTEAEWEYAARAGNPGARYGELIEIAWNFLNTEMSAKAVGTLKANNWGLHDVLGNVSEWTHDEYAGKHSEAQEQHSRREPVIRGCCWYDSARDCRAAGRDGSSAAGRYFSIGLRPARSVP